MAPASTTDPRQPQNHWTWVLVGMKERARPWVGGRTRIMASEAKGSNSFDVNLHLTSQSDKTTIIEK